jgi:hypothetical protein
MRRILNKTIHYIRRLFFGDLLDAVEASIVLTAQLHVQRIKNLGSVTNLAESEFKAFSQWGEDGIIQYLINKLPIERKSFVEFGVGNYTESNTRFLLINDNWHGLIIDGSAEYISYIENDPIYWKHYITAEHQFITCENINTLLTRNGFTGDIGLLSIDIDGNDYWLWDSITAIKPRIVICEYNSLYGAEHAVTIPYLPDFRRTNAHFSNLYYGASLRALCILASAKGYDFVGTNSAGSNAFFIRSDIPHGLKSLSPSEGYVHSSVRESRDKKGNLTFLSGRDRLDLVKDMPLFDVETSRVVNLGGILQQ